MKSKIQTNLLKSCKECKTQFLITVPEIKSRGNRNCLRRVFCTEKCKNLFGRKKEEGKINKKCNYCNTQFVTYTSSNRTFCSIICKNNSQIKTITKICLNCNKTFKAKPSRINKLYCSRECFNNFNRITKICVTCKKIFQVKKSDSHIIRCSRKCQFTDQSNGKIKIHLNGRTGYRIDLGFSDYFKSALEADFARVLNFFNIKYRYESKTFTTKNGAYTPDFFLPDLNLFVELKGVENTGKPFEILMTKNLSKQSVVAADFNIITITQKEFIAGLKLAEIWLKIPNLEQRNYKKSKELVVKYEDQKNKSDRI